MMAKAARMRAGKTKAVDWKVQQSVERDLGRQIRPYLASNSVIARIERIV